MSMFRGQKDREPNLVDPPASFKSPVLLDLFKLRPTKESEKLTKPKVFAKFAVSYSSGNTSNMSTYLKRKHPEITLQKPESKPKNLTAEQAYSMARLCVCQSVCLIKSITIRIVSWGRCIVTPLLKSKEFVPFVSKFFPFRVDPFQKMVSCAGKQNSHKNCLSCK